MRLTATAIRRRPTVAIYGSTLLLAAIFSSPAAASPGDHAGTASRPATAPARQDGTPDGAAATAPGAQPSAPASLDRQETLDRAADQIRAASVDITGSGFSGDRIDVTGNTVTLYWHGTLTPQVISTIEHIRATGITVDVRSAAFTLTQLLAESDRLIRDAATVEGYEVVTAGPAADGSGVAVGVSSTSGASPADDGQRIVSELTRTVPLTVVHEERPRVATRYSDTSPFHGGAYGEIYNAQNQFQNACTTAFGVTASSGTTYLLTAAHCGVGQWRTGSGTVIGPTGSRDLQHDAELIQAAGTSSIYDGPSVVTGDTSRTIPITGASTSHAGDTVCASGSYSGTMCGFVVVSTNESVNLGGFGTVTNMVRVEASDRATGIGNGDSGGSVYAGSVARGTVSAYDADPSTWVSCAGVPSGSDSDPNARHCAWRWWYPDVTVQLSSLGVRIP